LEKRKEIEFLEVDKSFKVNLGNPIKENLQLESNETEWNLKWIKADRVWKKGFQGKGSTLSINWKELLLEFV
jgi:hypothetical protein